MDVTNKDDQLDIITNKHNRAHRNIHENFKYITNTYFFPDIKKQPKSLITNCKISLENKYQRKPTNIEIGKTPIPNSHGEILHIDILNTDKGYFYLC